LTQFSAVSYKIRAKKNLLHEETGFLTKFKKLLV